jgi:thymidylate synthase (FAD)
MSVTYIADSVIPGMTMEEHVAYMARISNPANQAHHDTAPRLVKYLATHQHWSPFEMVSITMQIDTTRDIARQILRHRSFSFQEFSQRYAIADLGTVLREARLQDTANRQSSIDVDDATLHTAWAMQQERVAEQAQHAYEWALSKGIAKEVARSVLPEGLTMSRMYMAGTLRSWIHYCIVRRHWTTQKEHRIIAEQAWRHIVERMPSVEGLG